MRWTCLLVSVLSRFAFAEVHLSTDAFQPVNKNFNQGTYYAANFALKPFAAALAQAEKAAGAPLQTRGEAHMTLLTPPEFMRLQPPQREKLLKELQALDWSKSLVSAVCVGKGEAEVKGRTESAYFVVLNAKAVQTIREKYGLRDFYPHVTLGFTRRDLHAEDGVHKDATSCLP